jgi:putative ABC transport system substrate-binding protein
LNGARPAARSLGLELHVLSAKSDREIDDAFAKLAQLKAGALLISPETFFISRSKQLAELSATGCRPRSRHASSSWPAV